MYFFWSTQVKHVNGSVCTGLQCSATQVFVNARESYCVVFLNRYNAIPAFSVDANSTTSIDFKVAGCTSPVWRMIYVVAVIVVMLVLMGCCVGAFVHLRKVRLLPRPVPAPQVAQLATIRRTGSIPAQPNDDHQILFTVAKI